MNIAIIDNNVVTNMVSGELDVIGSMYPESISVDASSLDIGIGYTYIDGVFKVPVAEKVESKVSKVSFLGRFSLAELVALEELAETSAQVRVLRMLLDAATDIYVDSDIAKDMQAVLEGTGVISSNRSKEIFS